MTSGVKKGLAWIALAGAIVYVAIMVIFYNPKWWVLIPAFFVFMSTFSELVSLYIIKSNKIVGTKMNKISFIFSCCFVLSLIIVAILLS